MEILVLKKDCLRLLNLDLDGWIYMTGYVEKTNNLNEYIATAYMLKTTHKTLLTEEMEKLFLCDLPVFFLKKTHLGFNYVQHEKFINTRGKICKLLTWSIDDTTENTIYKAKIIISNLNSEIFQDLTSYLFVCGNEDLEEFAGFLFLN